MFQSVGFKNRVWGPAIDRFAVAASVALFVGYAAVPVGVMLGWVR